MIGWYVVTDSTVLLLLHSTAFKANKPPETYSNYATMPLSTSLSVAVWLTEVIPINWNEFRGEIKKYWI